MLTYVLTYMDFCAIIGAYHLNKGLNMNSKLLLKHEYALALKRVKEYTDEVARLEELGAFARTERETLAYWKGRADALEVMAESVEE